MAEAKKSPTAAAVGTVYLVSNMASIMRDSLDEDDEIVLRTVLGHMVDLLTKLAEDLDECVVYPWQAKEAEPA
jgi:hypothetical protein